MNRSRKVRTNRPESNSLAMKNTIKHSREGSYVITCTVKCRHFDPFLMVHHFPFLCREVSSSGSLANFLEKTSLIFVIGLSQAKYVKVVHRSDK